MATDKQLMEMAEVAHREKQSKKALRRRVAEKTNEMVETGVTLAGGALGGAISGKFPGRKVAGIPAGTGAGAAMLVVGMLGGAGRASNIVRSAGEGVLSYEIGKAVEKRVAKTATKSDATAGYMHSGERRVPGQKVTVEDLEAQWAQRVR